MPSATSLIAPAIGYPRSRHAIGGEVEPLSMHGPSRQLSGRDGFVAAKAWPALRSALASGAEHAPQVATAATMLLAYVGLEWISFIHEHKGVPVTPWNPGLGIAFGILVLRGAAYGVVLFAAVVIAETVVLRTQLAWPVIIAMAGLIAASFSVTAGITRRYLRLDVGLGHVRDVLILLGAGTAAAAVSACLLTALLLGADELTIADLAQSSLPLFVGDVIGIAVMTPLLLRLSVRLQGVAPWRLATLIPEVVLHAAVIGLTLWLILDTKNPHDDKFLSLLFLPVVAAGVRHGIDGSCIALAATQLGLVALLHQHGYNAAEFTQFQVVMLALTMSGLLVGVVVSERQRADLAVREAEARLKEMQAEAAQAARTNMVSGMASALAHEISQPLTAARALARSAQEILRSPGADMPRAGNNLANLIAQIDHAGGVVRRMREFLRRGHPHFSTLDVRQVLQDALVLARPEAAVRQAAIRLELAHDLPAIFGDRIQLQQVVLNLVHNAVEAIAESARPDGCITVAARRAAEDPSIEISVTDNGAGVAAGLALFEPLASSKKEGLGLGLSICASIVQAHGGRIWLQSGEAGATEFRFSLPIQPQGVS
jgi:two-component system sensor kinase FixL